MDPDWQDDGSLPMLTEEEDMEARATSRTECELNRQTLTETEAKAEDTKRDGGCEEALQIVDTAGDDEPRTASQGGNEHAEEPTRDQSEATHPYHQAPMIILANTYKVQGPSVPLSLARHLPLRSRQQSFDLYKKDLIACKAFFLSLFLTEIYTNKREKKKIAIMGCSSSKPEYRAPNAARYVGSYHAPYTSRKRRGRRSRGVTGVFVGGAGCGGGGM
ncbi:hypothetical protein AC579_422 [Pseudocercospora musae]|uniref:Uncharacterized protein n=1 Tax=Pseudocercospora musae TaxID=113226 RepID=A0A139HJ82_9PEZI|nr:hypothetical protein AC579_422 [Pseudocercospora musae]